MILNLDALFYDTIGLFSTKEPLTQEVDQSEEVAGQELGTLLTPKNEIIYDWGFGPYVYIFFLSTAFMGTIVLEGVDTSIMAKVTPAELNDMFINSGLLATLLGTMGRVLADVMITMSALLDIHVFVDFVNATFVPLLVIAVLGLWAMNKFYAFLLVK